MKNTAINTLLQIVTLLLVVIIGYVTFKSNANWDIISTELTKAKDNLTIAKRTITQTKSELDSARKEFERMKAQKELIIHKRDSLILSFKRKNAKNWIDLQRIKDSIQRTNDRLAEDRSILEGLLGLGT